MVTVLWFWSVWGFALAAFLFLMALPGVALQGFGYAAAPAVVHLLTLGVLLGGYYPLQAARWRACYGGNRFAEGLAWPIWAFHVAGTVLLVWGIYRGDQSVAYLGGHYLVPFAVVFSWLQGGAWLLRRSREAPRALETHLAGLGLFVVMPLGVMLVMDRSTGVYGFYGPPTILLHALAAAFLFFLPAQQAGGGAEGHGAGPVAAWSALAALGLLAAALSAEGFRGGLPLGLGMLGAVALWVGLPVGGEGKGRDWTDTALIRMRRLPWAVVGLLLLYAALRLLRGLSAAALQLAAVSATTFLLGVALPDWLYRLQRLQRREQHQAAQRSALARRAVVLLYAVQLGATVLCLIGQVVGSTPVLRVGLAVWLLSLGLLGLERLAGRLLRST